MYWGFNKSLDEMGKLVGCTDTCISRWMNKYDIPKKPMGYRLVELNQDKKHQSKSGKGRAKWTNSHYSHLASKRLKENTLVI